MIKFKVSYKDAKGKIVCQITRAKNKKEILARFKNVIRLEKEIPGMHDRFKTVKL
jgi:hypothetical protein